MARLNDVFDRLIVRAKVRRNVVAIVLRRVVYLKNRFVNVVGAVFTVCVARVHRVTVRVNCTRYPVVEPPVAVANCVRRVRNAPVVGLHRANVVAHLAKVRRNSKPTVCAKVRRSRADRFVRLHNRRYSGVRHNLAPKR